MTLKTFLCSWLDLEMFWFNTTYRFGLWVGGCSQATRTPITLWAVLKGPPLFQMFTVCSLSTWTCEILFFTQWKHWLYSLLHVEGRYLPVQSFAWLIWENHYVRKGFGKNSNPVKKINNKRKFKTYTFIFVIVVYILQRSLLSHVDTREFNFTSIVSSGSSCNADPT